MSLSESDITDVLIMKEPLDVILLFFFFDLLVRIC